jgi:hypothetical protein
MRSGLQSSDPKGSFLRINASESAGSAGWRSGDVDRNGDVDAYVLAAGADAFIGCDGGNKCVYDQIGVAFDCGKRRIGDENNVAGFQANIGGAAFHDGVAIDDSNLWFGQGAADNRDVGEIGVFHKRPVVQA